MNDNILNLIIAIASRTNINRYDYHAYKLENLIIDNPDSKNPILCNISHEKYSSRITIDTSDNRHIRVDYDVNEPCYGNYTKVGITIRLNDNSFVDYCFKISNKIFFSAYQTSDPFIASYSRYLDVVINRKTKTKYNFDKELNELIVQMMLTEDELNIIKKAIYNKLYDLEREALYNQIIESRSSHGGFINR